MHQTPPHQLYTHTQNAKAESEWKARQIRFMPMHVLFHVWDSGLWMIGHNSFNRPQNTSLTWQQTFCWAFSCPKRQTGALAGAGSSETWTKAIHQASSILFSTRSDDPAQLELTDVYSPPEPWGPLEMVFPQGLMQAQKDALNASTSLLTQ